MPLVLPGQESAVNEPWSRFDRHHHRAAYAALLISGSCEEAGDRGRFRASPGDVLVHAPYDGHGDLIGARGAAFINFTLDAPLGGWFGRVDDLDEILRAAGRDQQAATALLRRQFRAVDPPLADWPDLLARDLAATERVCLDAWAEAHGLHPTTVSRGFRKVFGVSPKRFRLERIASHAARAIRAGKQPLARIAADCGFADQAHMHRALVAMFGMRPSALRAC